MERRILLLALAAFFLSIAYDVRQSGQAQSPAVPTSQDICQKSVKLSVPISQATSVTTVVIANALNPYSPLDICGVNAVIASSSTLAFIAGTGTNCGTQTENITGPMTAATIGTNPLGTFAVVPTGKDLCLKTTGTGAGGAFTYAYGGVTQPTATQTPTPTPTFTPTATAT